MRRGTIYLFILVLSAALSLYGCDTGGSSSGGGGGGGGSKTIKASGGDGTTGPGGSADQLYIDSFAPVSVEKSGSVDASFSVPKSPAGYQKCSDEFRPVSSVTIPAVDDGGAVTANSYYMIFQDQDSTGYGYVRVDSNGNGLAEEADTVVDCIDIPSGVTVTFGLNKDDQSDSDGDDSTGSDNVEIFLSGDLRVAGTAMSAFRNSAAPDVPDDGENDYADAGKLEFNAANVFVTSSGRLIARGADSAVGRGGHGAEVALEANNNGGDGSGNHGGFLTFAGKIDASGGNGAAGFDGGHGCADWNGSVFTQSGDHIWLMSDGITVASGDIVGSGGNGDNGGDACQMSIVSYSHMYMTGTMTAEGGTGNDGDGGDADFAQIVSVVASVNVAGDISITGGDGTANGGSTKQGIDIYNGYNGYNGNNNVGAVNVKGSLNASGGNSNGAGDGGDAGYVAFYIHSGTFKLTADVTATGGEGMGGGNGGAGGYAEIDGNIASDFQYGAPVNEQEKLISANFTTDGGKGASGGDAGYIAIYTDDYEGNPYPVAGAIKLLGYSSITMNGGNSTESNGGDAGWYFIYTNYGAYNFDNIYDTPGAIINQVPLVANGGNGGTGAGDAGGEGGKAEFVVNAGDPYAAWHEHSDLSIVQNTAKIEINGGSGDIGGSSNGVFFYGYNDVTVSGGIDASGGNGITASGGEDWEVYIASTENVTNSGKINVKGGAGTDGDGGAGAILSMLAGGQVRNTNNLTATGGDGNALTGTGGDGGFIELWSGTKATSNTAPITVKAGTGDTDGIDGEIWIDESLFTPTL